MKTVSIVGFGRFGKTLYRLLKDDFDLTIFCRGKIDNKILESAQNTKITDDLVDVYQSEIIFFAVPISEFEGVIKSHKKYFNSSHILIDVLSVKMHPAQVFLNNLKDNGAQIILTHPMFGPDSSKNGFQGLPIILNNLKASNENYSYWKEYFTSKKLQVIEMTPDQHDAIAANTQGLTHFVGRLLQEVDLKGSPIDSLGTKKLLEIKEQTCNDTWQLFSDLQHYNPHTKLMRLNLGKAYDSLYNKLLPKEVEANSITIGIQGGRGSFNEEALQYFLKQEKISNHKVVYLHTSENVLKALHEGVIDRGQFAIHNSVGGIVDESIHAMAKYKFEIVGKFAIKISHAIMTRKDVEFDDVKIIMAHPQVFAQCKDTLLKKYPHLQLVSGEGELIDHALVAKALSEGKIAQNIGVMGSKVLAQIYNLRVIEDNLQDAKENYTSFLQVVRM